MITAFLALVRKDLRIFFQDRRAVIMAFVAPIMIGSFFGYVFGGQSRPNGAQGKTTVLVVDQEKDTLSTQILDYMRAEPLLQLQEASLEEAQDQVRKGKASVAVVIPAGFGRQAGQALLGQGTRPTLTFFEDPSRTMEAKMIQGMLMGQVIRALGHGSGMASPFEAKEQQLTSKDAAYNPYAHSFGGMAIQFILFLGIDVGIGMLLDRQRGLWKRFAASPISKWTLLASRTVSATIIVMLILAAVFAFARIAFGVRMQGSLIGFAAICMAFGLMTSTYGLVIASIGKTPQGARGLSILATLLMVMLSGAWIPSFLFPKWLQDATKFIPARWAMDGLDAMSWRGLGWQEAILPVVILIAFAAAFGTFAALRFRWEES
jgi:ABC-2 type transport system permease protein